MKTTKYSQRLALALISAATIVGASACGAAGTGSSQAPVTTQGIASQAATTPSGAATTMDSGTSASPTGNSTGTAAAATIHIKSFAYSGDDTVTAGASVTVMNMDSEAHTVTADDGSFNAVVKAGATATFTAPAKPGAYTFHCTYHSNMHGSLTVK